MYCSAVYKIAPWMIVVSSGKNFKPDIKYMNLSFLSEMSKQKTSTTNQLKSLINW